MERQIVFNGSMEALCMALVEKVNGLIDPENLITFVMGPVLKELIPKDETLVDLIGAVGKYCYKQYVKEDIMAVVVNSLKDMCKDSFKMTDVRTVITIGTTTDTESEFIDEEIFFKLDFRNAGLSPIVVKSGIEVRMDLDKFEEYLDKAHSVVKKNAGAQTLVGKFLYSVVPGWMLQRIQVNKLFKHLENIVARAEEIEEELVDMEDEEFFKFLRVDEEEV